MLPWVDEYLRSVWSRLSARTATPHSLRFLAQATGVTKACFFVFADDEDRPRYIVKVARSPLDNSRVLQEVGAVQRLRALLPGSLRATLPEPLLLTHHAKRLVVIEPVLPGRLMDSVVPPGQNLSRDAAATQLGIGYRWLVDMQCAAPHHTGPLTSQLVQEQLLAPIQTAIRNSDITAVEQDWLCQLKCTAESLVGQSLPLFLYHGDFRPGNVLLDAERIAVVDWEFSRVLAPPLLDWFSFVFRLKCRAMDLPDIDGSIESYRAAFREVFLDQTWYSELVARYTRLYCRELGVDQRFLPLLLGLFMVTNINKFHAFLVERVDRGYLYLLANGSGTFEYRLRRQAYVSLVGSLASTPTPYVLRDCLFTPSPGPSR